MDLDRFEASLADERPPPEASPLLQALWHDARGNWAEAHARVQSQAGARAAAVHAYLHRKEGDLANADYWYARAASPRPDGDLQMEWRALVQAELREAGGGAAYTP